MLQTYGSPELEAAFLDSLTVGDFEPVEPPASSDRCGRIGESRLANRRIRLGKSASSGWCIGELTGSANLLRLPSMPDSLAGRVERIELHGFSQGELAGHSESFIDRLLAGERFTSHVSALHRHHYLQRAAAGGYPEALARPEGRRRDIWFDNYADGIVRREAADLTGAPHWHDRRAVGRSPRGGAHGRRVDSVSSTSPSRGWRGSTCVRATAPARPSFPGSARATGCSASPAAVRHQ